MITPDKLSMIEHAMRNVGALFASAMMQGLAEALGQLAGALDPAVLTGQAPPRDLTAEVQKAMTPETLSLFEEAENSEEMKAAFARVEERIDDAMADAMITTLTSVDVGLPPLTQKVPSEVLAGYLVLLNGGHEPLREAVGSFMAQMESLLAPRTAAELEETYSQKLSSITGGAVQFQVDRATCGEGIDAMPQAGQVESAFQQLAMWDDWKKSRLAKVERVVVRGVPELDGRGFTLAGGLLAVSAVVSSGADGVLYSQDLSSAIEEQWKAEVAAERRALRGQRSIDLGHGFTGEVTGVRLVAPMDENQSEDLRAFSEYAGLAVVLLIRNEQGPFVSFDSESSKIVACTDDQGGDLLSSALSVRDERPEFGSFPKVTADGTAASIEVRLPALPKPGATQVHLETMLTFKVGGPISEHHAPLPLEVGAQFTCGPYTFEVSNVSDGDSTLDVTITARVGLEALAYLRFRATNGDDIAPRYVSSSRSGWENDITEEREISFDKESLPESLELWIGTWDSIDTLELPASFEFGLGL